MGIQDYHAGIIGEFLGQTNSRFKRFPPNAPAFIIRPMTLTPIIGRWPWLGTAAALCLGLMVRAGGAANIEPAIIPSVHATLTPTSAIQAPLRFAADQTSVWRSDLEQQMLLTGRVSVTVGYRQLKADGAAVWLTPSRESGANTYDVAIYLAGNVEVREGDSAASTVTTGKELLVTTRVSQNVQLAGNALSQAEQDSPLVKRGNEIRNQLLTRQLAPLHIALPQMTLTSAEDALQSGWIARGPNNRIIPGPGDIQVLRDAQGHILHVVATQPGEIKPPKPRPDLIVIADPGGVARWEQVGKEMVTVVPGPYVLYDSRDGKPPLEFRAQRLVAFSPLPEEPATATAPSTAAATAPARTPATAGTAPGTGPANSIAQRVTGVYLEGDVTLDQGNQVMVRAERIYFDFTSWRAIMLDATLATVDAKRNVPVYMRASEIRQLARGEFAAKNVQFSTSEFYTPHYHIGASEVYLRDVTPQLETPNAGNAPGSGLDLALGGGGGQKTFKYEVNDATLNVGGVPIFYWPFLAGDTSKNDIPLRTVRISNSRTYGLSLLTDWDIFGLAGQTEPTGVRADLNIDYFGKRGPAGGVQAQWKTDEDHGILRSYAIMDQGTDQLGRSRENVPLTQETRGRLTLRDQRDLGDGWTLQLEGSYISDPNFLEQFFQREFDVDKEHETSIYLKKQGETDALTFLGKFNLMDFTATADQVDDQFSTEKRPEVKYWRIGDSLLDMFTYYSETSGSDLHMDITDFTPNQLGLRQAFLGVPASVVARDKPDQTFRAYAQSMGWTTGDVLRGDTRQELDMPLQFGDAKITPYVAGRLTYWDTAFPENTGDSTTRLWGGGGIRSSMQFWKVYDDVQSTFFDLHRIRHVVEPQFNIFAGGANVDRKDLQPFDRSVEGITGSSGMQVSVTQKWQTKRGGEGHWRDVDWLVLNVSWNQFWNKDQTGAFFPMAPTRGYYFMSRPDLSLATDSITLDAVWRVGERVRMVGEADYSLDSHNVEQAAAGVAVDQTQNLSYFIGNRYVRTLNTDEWTFAVDYQLTKKYELIAAESYDFKDGANILSSVTLVRKMPRFVTALTVTYDANNADTTVVFTAWPEGFPNSGFGNQTGTSIDRR